VEFLAPNDLRVPLNTSIPTVVRVDLELAQGNARLLQEIFVADPDAPVVGVLFRVRVDALGHEICREPLGLALIGETANLSHGKPDG
jgi:hypothetical protein